MNVDYKTLSDENLTAFLKLQDHFAFTEIYERYWAVLYLHARRMLHDKDEARDIVQDLFANLWKKSKDLDFNVRLSSYLYKSIRNRIFNHIEHQKVVTEYQKSLIEFVGASVPSSDELVREKELTRIIEREIQALPPRMREIFELSRRQHLSYKDIAEQLDISEHTVKRQVSNSLGILRAKLGVPSLILVMLLSR